jgi:hypothetical protein
MGQPPGLQDETSRLQGEHGSKGELPWLWVSIHGSMRSLHDSR